MTMLGLLIAAGMLTKVLVVILICVHFILCLFLIAVVLLQSGKAGDLSSAFGGGASQANVAAMSSENILTRATKFSAFGFMATSLLLALFAHGDADSGSVLDVVGDEAAVERAVEPGADASDPAAASSTDAPAVDEAPDASSPAALPARDAPAGQDAAAEDTPPEAVPPEAVPPEDAPPED